MKSLIRIAGLILGIAAFPGSQAFADTISGRVVDAMGVGVAGIDIDVKNLGSGGTPPIFNDGTNALGFFTTTLPAGIYRVTFTPPPPPVTTSLIKCIEPVVVVGATALGVITLDPGVILSGHVQDQGGVPVAGVNLNVIDSTGDSINLSNDFTNIFGNFIMAVPAGPIKLQFNATPVIGATLASQQQDLNLVGNTVLSTVILEPGFAISGFLQTTAGVPVEDADVDSVDSLTNEKIYTPGDNTQPNGLFSFVVPAGTWDFQFCPTQGERLVALELKNTVVAAALGLGAVQLEPGVELQGRITGFGGLPVQNADVDVTDFVSRLDVFTCTDNTDSNGNYSVIVPARALDIRFQPSNYFSGLGSEFHGNVPITGNTTLDGVLPACNMASNYGAGHPGAGGIVPHMTTSGGVPSEGNKGFGLRLENGKGGSLAVLVLSFGQASFPLFGGTGLVAVVPGQHWIIVRTLDGALGSPGTGTADYDPGSLVGFSGFTGYAQFLVRDLAAVGGWALSEGLQIDVCP